MPIFKKNINILIQEPRSDTPLRHEIKLLMSYADYMCLRQKLKAVCPLDENCKNGDYFIRSLYFDDNGQTAYRDKQAGVGDRKKYRMRIYNLSDEPIKLECKEKIGDRIRKRSIIVSADEAREIQQGDFSCLAERSEQLAKEIYGVSRSIGLSPSVIVDYDREAYVHEVSNVRLTFDKALHAGGSVNGFDIFGDEQLTLPVFPNDSVIFEVKYDEYMPSFLANVIANSCGAKLALSKFCMCKDIMSSAHKM